MLFQLQPSNYGENNVVQRPEPAQLLFTNCAIQDMHELSNIFSFPAESSSEFETVSTGQYMHKEARDEFKPVLIAPHSHI